MRAFGAVSELETMGLLLVLIKVLGGVSCEPLPLAAAEDDSDGAAAGAETGAESASASASASAAGAGAGGSQPPVLQAMAEWRRRLIQHGAGAEMFARHALLRSHRGGDVALDRAWEPDTASGGATDGVLQRKFTPTSHRNLICGVSLTDYLWFCRAGGGCRGDGSLKRSQGRGQNNNTVGGSEGGAAWGDG